MPMIETLTQSDATGQDQFGVSGKQLRLDLTDEGLVLGGSKKSEFRAPFVSIERIRIGYQSATFGVASAGRRQEITRIWIAGGAKPIEIRSSPGNPGYVRFVRALAARGLANNVRVERGYGYAVPAIFGAVLVIGAIVLAVRLAQAIAAEDGVTSALLALLVLVGSLSFLVWWTWSIYAPRRVSDIHPIDKVLAAPTEGRK